MKITFGFKVHGLILAAAFCAGGVFGTNASAQLAYHSYLIDLNSKTATDIGTLGRGYSVATGINATGQVTGTFVGQVAGESTTKSPLYHAFITGPNGMGMRDLDTFGGHNLEAGRINDAGQVVGRSSFTAGPPTYAFITGPNGMGATDIGALGGAESSAGGINATGQVVGEVAVQGYWHAFITGPDGMGMRDLGTLGTLGDTQSRGNGINDAGQVVGFSYSGGVATHAFITGPDGMGMRDLGTLGGNDSSATDINDAGQATGFSYTAEGTAHAFITGPNGMGMRDLGALGGKDSFALGINDAGQVAGYSLTADGFHHPFITGPDGIGMIDLNSLVHLPAGVVLTDAYDINNAGQVIVNSIVNPPPIPEPESYALFLAGLCLVRLVAWRKGINTGIVNVQRL